METQVDDLAPGPPPAPAGDRAAYYRARAAEAMARARALVGRPWTSDPGLRVQVEAILAMTPQDRLRQLEDQVETLSALRPIGRR
ncbi:hypothetical protein [Parafrankia discariae]|uniref:hypothetical protein n=1 Tax=Parafrankia discariae TaxID=365528 RepID=UPI0003AA1BD0|nr:hypothetical protein [Parafrankia discariae]